MFSGGVSLLFAMPDRADDIRDRAFGFRKGLGRCARWRHEVLGSAANEKCGGEQPRRNRDPENGEELTPANVRFGLPVQPVDATLFVLEGKDGAYDETSRVFSSHHCGRETGRFGVAGSVRKTLGFKPQQKE